MEPGDLLDQIDLAHEVGPPAGHVHRDPAIVRLGDDRGADGDQILLDRVPGDLDAEHLGDARGTKKMRGGCDGSGQRSSGVGKPAAAGREHQLDAAAHRVAGPRSMLRSKR